MTDYNRLRPAEEHVRFLGFDAPMEMTSADSPREALSLTYTYLQTQLDEEDLPWPWERINGLLGNDTVEALLYTLSPGAHLLPADDLARAADNAEPRLKPRPAVSNNHGYFPLDPGALRDLDAVLFLRDVADGHPKPRK